MIKTKKLYIGKVDTLLRIGKCMRNKTYSGRIKPTKGLSDLGDPRVKPLSHRIVRRKLNREMNKEIKEL